MLYSPASTLADNGIGKNFRSLHKIRLIRALTQLTTAQNESTFGTRRKTMMIYCVTRYGLVYVESWATFWANMNFVRIHPFALDIIGWAINHVIGQSDGKWINSLLAQEFKLCKQTISNHSLLLFIRHCSSYTYTQPY